ncbi:PsbB mRNA maturation factor Mbb1, chloroplastic, partial [Tetrabaena socialis]
MVLVPPADLWRGVKTRGPAEKACSSAGSPSSQSTRLTRPVRRRAVDASASSARSFWGIAPGQLAPEFSSLVAQSTPSARSLGGDTGVERVARGDEKQQPAPGSPPKTLKINVDLLLWRCRTARIQARQSLDAEERKTLYKAAEDGLRRCLDLDPTDARAYVVLGKALLQQKRFDEARALYQDGCLNTGNSNAYIWSSWGWLESKTGNIDRARKLYDAAVVVDSTHACAWHKWGMLEKKQGNYTRARDLWMQGLQQCRRKEQAQNAYLYNALGCMAAQLGRVGEARQWFSEGTASAEGASSVALWQAWGVLETGQGDPSVVRYLFGKALLANPRSRYVHLAWALWERKQGNWMECQALLRKGCLLNPTDPALFQAWALVEKQAGKFNRARALFERGLKADPGYLYLWQAYGVMEAELGNLDRARQLFQEGVWADPRSANTVFIFHAWGSLEWRTGNFQTARELFRAAVRAKMDALAKPAGSLGVLEQLACRLAALQGSLSPQIGRACLLVCGADHGVTAARPEISAFPRVGSFSSGNTTSAAALLAALTGAAPEDVCGRGTGVDDAGLAAKVAAVREALAANAGLLAGGGGGGGGGGGSAGLTALRAVGGLELAAIAGAVLEAARLGIALVVDGFIS